MIFNGFKIEKSDVMQGNNKAYQLYRNGPILVSPLIYSLLVSDTEAMVRSLILVQVWKVDGVNDVLKRCVKQNT